MELIHVGINKNLKNLKTCTNFGRRLARLRNAQGLTQEKLAEKADIHWRYLQKVEAGTSNPSLVVLLKIKKALNCAWEKLLDKLG